VPADAASKNIAEPFPDASYCAMIPASANEVDPLLININLSLTYKLSALTNEAVPLTIKSPPTVKLLLNVELPVT